MAHRPRLSKIEIQFKEKQVLDMMKQGTRDKDACLSVGLPYSTFANRQNAIKRFKRGPYKTKNNNQTNEKTSAVVVAPTKTTHTTKNWAIITSPENVMSVLKQLGN